MEGQPVAPGMLQRDIGAVGGGTVLGHGFQPPGSGAGVTWPPDAQGHLGVIDALVCCSVKHSERDVIGPRRRPVVHPGLGVGPGVTGHGRAINHAVLKSQTIDGLRLNVDGLGLAGTQRQRDNGAQQERARPVARGVDDRRLPAFSRWAELDSYRRMTRARAPTLQGFGPRAAGRPLRTGLSGVR